MRIALPLLALLAVAPNARAQEVTATPSGDYLVRFRHFEGRNFAPGGDSDFVRQRARIGLGLAYGDELRTFVQIQDTRTWGEETDTQADASADGLDLHQGYLDLTLDPHLRLRIGRQQVSYLNQRLIGNWGSSEQPRSFDAVRVSADAFDQTLTIDAFYARLFDTLPPDSLAADDLFAWTVRLDLGAAFKPALIGAIDLSSGSDRVRATNGLVIEGEPAVGLRYLVEGYLQAGHASTSNVDYLAWMFGTRLRYTVDVGVKPYLEVFVEMLSGDDDPDDAKEGSFDTLYATNVRYYGEGNFFLNPPKDTAKRGLSDAGAALGMAFGQAGFAQVTFHLFTTVESQGWPSDLAQELDLTILGKVSRHLTIDANYSLILPGAALSPDGDAEHFFFVRSLASF